MISEKAFTEKDKILLEKTSLTTEMAQPKEWYVREEANPDELILVYVSFLGDLKTLQVACSCLRGAQDKTCPHALDVINRVRADKQVMDQLLIRKTTF